MASVLYWQWARYFFGSGAVKPQNNAAYWRSAFSTALINQPGHLIPVKHASPTLFFNNIYRVHPLRNMPTKEASTDSFPGEHGLMLLIFAGFMLRYCGKRAFLIALAIFLARSSPGMMTDAHWFTDVYADSLAMALPGLPRVRLTSTGERLIHWFSHHLPAKNKTNKQQKTNISPAQAQSPRQGHKQKANGFVIYYK